jgi:hypothetical protein
VGAATKNPAHGIEKPKSKPRDRYRRGILGVRALAIPPLKVAMDLALLIGLRRGDILNLTRDTLTDECLLVKTGKTNKALLF